ncbi:MAG: hypothetical protein JXR03_12205 [Cyclobacteriaceae bacterium]
MVLIRSSAILSIFLLLSCASNQPIKVETWKQHSSNQNLMQAISIVDEETIWLSGHGATFCKTVDSGKTWEVFSHPSDTLQFRDIHAFDESNAVLMSAGPGSSSRIYLFDGQTIEYKEAYVMPHPEGFLNTIEFWDNKNGLAFGDSFNGQLFVLKTTDGGQTWSRINPSKLPPAGKGEGGFAASGTCISLLKGGKAYIGTGAGGNSRILSSTDYGDTWTHADSPLARGEAAGIFSIRMKKDLGLIAGGDLNQSDSNTSNVALSEDGGKSWKLTNAPLTKGAFYGSDLERIKDQNFIFVCGPGGIDYSFNKGETWINQDTTSYWAMDIHKSGFGYAVGTEGKILRIEIN